MPRFQDIYKRELHNIKQSSKEFAENYPNIAPMLRAESSDPDVERLFEGFAYISAQIQEIIDDQIPEFSSGMIKKFFPHYLRPLPSATIMHFEPKSKLPEVLTVKKGTYFNSMAVNNTKCKFRLVQDCVVDPLKINDINLVKSIGKKKYIEIDLELAGANVANWSTDNIKLYLGDNYAAATQLYYLMLQDIDSIEIVEPQNSFSLSAVNIRAGGFTDNDALLPYPGNADTSYRVLQEYFMMPEKFLYINIGGLKQWHRNKQTNSFKLRFFLKGKIDQIPELSKQSFVLHTAPAINVFTYEAKPIDIDNYQYQYPIYPDTKDRQNFTIYAVNTVYGYEQGNVKPKQYISVDDLNSTNAHQPCFDISNKFSPTNNGLDYYISIINYDYTDVDKEETLSVKLECTNGALPKHLALGEINGSSNNSSSLLNFRNITIPSSYKNPPNDNDWMWRLQSLLALNYLPLANAENLKSLLEFYLFLNKGEHISSNKFQLQISSIADVEVSDCDKMIAGVSVRGYHINIKLNMSKFSSKGEVFLFGTVLSRFFSMYSTINTFTLLVLTDILSGENIVWPARINNQSLI